MDDWDATESLRRLRAGQISTAELVDATIARAEAAADVHAIVVDTYQRARDAATTRRAGPLAGLPTFLKDLSQEAGVATAWGSAGAATLVSRKTDPFVARLARTGALVLGKSTTPELGLTATTEPLYRGPTRNPWDRTRSPGGSSGGAAALVAAGVVPLACASDGGGSIRIPAACCGLVGLKRTRGVLDMEGSNLLPVNIAVHGCVTRTVRDTVLFHQAMTGLGPVASAPSRRLNIGLYVDAPAGTAVDAEVVAAVRAAGRACEGLGHRVDELPCPLPGQANADFLTYWGFLAWLQLRTARLVLHRGFDPTRIEPWTRGLAATFTGARRAGLAAIRRLRRFRRTYVAALGKHDVLLSPTVATVAPPLGHLAPDAPFATHFERVRTFAAFTPLHNAAGAPAISLPLGRSATGLPIGVQLAAAPHQDGLLLALAAQLEAAHPWPTRVDGGRAPRTR